MIIPPLSNEVGGLTGFFFRQAVLFFAKGNAFHQKRHVPGQSAHGLEALRVLDGLPRQSAVDAVPILAGGYWHPRDGEELVQFIEGGGQSAPAGHHHADSVGDDEWQDILAIAATLDSASKNALASLPATNSKA